MLLGQTVNSYLHQENGKPANLADLLYRLNDIEGLERIRFVTSYPGDFAADIEFLKSVKDLDKLALLKIIMADRRNDNGDNYE